MSSETARLRALLFGEGEFARAEPLEPSLLPPLLRLVPIQPMVLAAVDLVVQLYPDLRREALSAVASGLGAMPAEERDALLRVHPALLLYAARDVLEKARELAQDQPDPALRVLLLVKLAVLGVGNRGAALDALRALARATGRDEAARLDGWLQVAERGGPAEREEAVAALRGSPELIYHPDLVAALAQLLPPTERVQVSRAALDALVQTDVQAPELGSWALTRLAPGLTAGEQADVFARALSLAGSLPARWQRLEAARHVLSALRRQDVGPDTRTAVGRLLPGLIRGEEARTPILAYLQAHLRESDAPLPPIHPLAAQAAQLARAAGKADPGEAARVALDALVGSLDRWFPREPQPTTRRPTPSGAFMFDMMDQLGVEAPPAPAPRPAAPAPPPPTIEAAAIPEAPKPRAMQPFKKLARVRAPRRAEPVSTGFATSSRPGEPMDQDRPIAPGEPCHFWLEVGEVEGSIEVRPTPLPVDLLPATARLDVVLFAPDGGFRLKPGEDLGRLDLQPDGTARVASQPARKYGKVDQNLLQRRLLFPLTAPDRSGSYRLRCSIYCRGVLVQSRLIRVEVGDTDRTSRVDFTLATRLDPARLGRLAEQRLAMLSNHRPNGNHDFYLYGRDGNEVFRASISIPPTTLGGALEIARAALRRASWGDEGPWARTKRYRYAGRPRIETLREDLAVLAIAGWRIYDLLVNHLAGGTKKVRAFEALVRQPGLLQISPDATLGLVLPAALIYDYKIQPQAKPPGEFSLCAEFERAFRAATPLEQTACFQGQCPSRGLPTTVCPSGFWGFRHGLGLPISDVETGDEQEAQLDPRLEYQDVPLVVMGLSRSRDLPRTRQHARELQALRPAWGNRGWLVADRLDALMDFMRSKQPHVVYLYCHGSGRPVGAVEFPMLYLGEDPDKAEPGEWLERSMLRGEIEWTKPRPLVFLNGCHTTVLDARTTLDFVTGFVQNARACGVVGTEVTVFEELAGAFARRFMDRFLAGAVVGQAIRDARLDLLRQGNPLGLVYTPFVLSGTQLVPAGT